MDLFVLLVFFSISSSLSAVLYILRWLLKTYGSRIRRGQKSKDTLAEILLVGSLTFAWYAVSITFTIYNKWLMGTYDGGFRFPLINTTIHMFIKLGISRIWYMGSKEKIEPVSTNILWCVVALIGICTAGDVAMSNESLVFISVSLYTILKTTVLVSTYVWGTILGLEAFRFKTLFVVLLISGGVCLAVFSTVNFSYLGVVLCIGASCLGGLRWALLQHLMTADNQSYKNIFVALYRFSPYSAFSILPLSSVLEGPKLVADSRFTHETTILEVFSLSLLGGIISFVLIVVEVKLVRVTSSLTMGVLGQVKEVTQIALSMLIYKDKISLRGALGIVVSLVAAQYYTQLKVAERAEDGGGAGEPKSKGEDDDLKEEMMEFIPKQTLKELDVFDVELSASFDSRDEE